MARIVVCGAGVCGLTTAMLLAKDGHEVTVLERDPAAPPTDPAASWEEWERRGVNQFRLPHFLLPGFRAQMDAELPYVVDELLAFGAHRFNPLGVFAEGMDPKATHVIVTARRPIVEAAIASAASKTAGLAIRRGVPVAGLVLDAGEDHGRRVTGVRTEDGEEVAADLVVDAGGRRSPLARWLVEAGLPAPTVEEEDSGFVYYGRHVVLPGGQSSDQPGVAFHGSVGLLWLPADRGTVGVGIIASSKDAELRVLRHEEPWRAVLALIPGGDQVLACEVSSPLVAMAGIEDRWRRFVVDGEPVATGVVSVADAWAATNPTLGRGITLGTHHAIALRDLLREIDVGDAEAVVRGFDDVTQERLTPWYRATIWHDRNRLADLDDAIAGTARELDPEWSTFRRFEVATAIDPSLVSRMLDGLHLRETPLDLVRDPAIAARVDELVAEVPAPTGASRSEVLAAAGVR
jgi:2-polyprenyl-6-methoxyphenol hydroxylase-like FAD-dependent oxidoreductase